MQLTRRPLLLGAAAAGLVSGAAFAQTAADFEGEWNGVLDVGAAQLRLRLIVEPGPAVSLISVDQGGARIPGAEARIEGATLSVHFPAVSASYTGTLQDGRIVGEFTQGQAFPLNFQRGEVEAAAPDALTQAGLAALRAEAGAPALGAAAANRDGRALSLADGLRMIGREENVTTSDRWHLGSITKSMTATLVARCVEAGDIAWSDTVGGVLGAAVPDMRDEYRDANFLHLLSHQAGLQANIPQLALFPRYRDDAREDRVRLAQFALQQEPEGPKGESFTYSNSGYVIAGAMLEARLGATWETLIQERVFAPLGMSTAGQGAPGNEGAYDQPVGHAALTADAALQAFPPGAMITDNPAALGPAGRAHASFEDVLKYLDAHRERRAPFLSAESWQALHTPHFGGEYALGWVRRGDMLWHNGSNTLWYAEVMFDRNRGVSAVAAANDGRLASAAPAVGAALVGAAAAVS